MNMGRTSKIGCERRPKYLEGNLLLLLKRRIRKARERRRKGTYYSISAGGDHACVRLRLQGLPEVI